MPTEHRPAPLNAAHGALLLMLVAATEYRQYSRLPTPVCPVCGDPDGIRCCEFGRD